MQPRLMMIYPISKTSLIWRLRATDVSWVSGGLGYDVIVKQFKMFASTDGSGTDLAFDKPANASSWRNYQATYHPDNANHTTVNNWMSGQSSAETSTPQWWSVNLGGYHFIHSVIINSYNTGAGAPYIAKSYALEWSTNGIYWTTQSTFNTNGTTRDEVLYTNL